MVGVEGTMLEDGVTVTEMPPEAGEPDGGVGEGGIWRSFL
jgi:hypothetical protein